jgi:hypothetical protein
MSPTGSVKGSPGFRNSQSFFVSRADQLLEKLRWDLTELEQLRWNDELGESWGQVVSYKAIDCAMSIWHLAEWFAQDIWAKDPVVAACAFLDIPNHDPWFRIPQKTLRDAAVVRCPELEICRVIAIASKHYEVGHQPRPDITTQCYLSYARRGPEAFMRPVMWLSVLDSGNNKELRGIFHACFSFWAQLRYVSRAGTTWQKGQDIPTEPLPAYVAPATAQPTVGKPQVLERLRLLLRIR